MAKRKGEDVDYVLQPKVKTLKLADEQKDDKTPIIAMRKNPACSFVTPVA